MARLLLITGPQGSGNHLFSKCLAVHKDVFGWKTLLSNYWEGHHHEPFADAWENPELLHKFDWDQSEYFVTSISSPYFKNQQAVVPKYEQFINTAKQYVDKIDVAVIGRDQTILKYQQSRVRKQQTTQIALDSFKWLFEKQQCTFLSQELLLLYKENYLQQVSKQLDWPVAYLEVDEILANDANEKYIKNVQEYWLDNEVYQAVKES